MIASQSKEVRGQFKHNPKHGRICFYEAKWERKHNALKNKKTKTILMLMLNTFSR